MSTVTIYQFTAWDPVAEYARKSRRWGTREAIETIVRGRVLDSTAAEVDASAIESDIPGLTERGFDPYATRSRPSPVDSPTQATMDSASAINSAIPSL